jgi:hypothetical protein
MASRRFAVLSLLCAATTFRDGRAAGCHCKATKRNIKFLLNHERNPVSACANDGMLEAQDIGRETEAQAGQTNRAFSEPGNSVSPRFQ